MPQSPTDPVTVNGKKKVSSALVKFSLYGLKRPYTLYPNQISVSLPSQNQLSRQNLCWRAYDWVTTPNVTTSNLTNHCARCSTCSFEHFVTSVINKGTDKRQLYAYRQLYSICDLRDLSHSLSLSLSLSLSFSACYQRFCQ